MSAAAFKIIEPGLDRRKGYVYFVTDGDLTKIGHSMWPLDRFKQLRSPSGKPMELLGWFRGYMDEEHSLHNCFAELNVPGGHGVEWFRDDGRIAAFMTQCKGWERHLTARRISLVNLALGKFPEATHPDDIPRDADVFMAWGNTRSGDWPEDVQVKAGRFAWRQTPIDDFLAAYTDWFGPTTPFVFTKKETAS